MGRSVNLPTQINPSALVISEDVSNRTSLEPNQFITYVADNQGFAVLKTDIDFGYNPRTGTLSSQNFLGDLIGQASTAERLSNPRKIKFEGPIFGENQFDGSTDITIVTDFVANSINLGEHTSGAYVRTLNVSPEGGLVITDLSGTNSDEGEATLTIEHANTSEEESIEVTGGSIINKINIDKFGHITEFGTFDLDNRYYTESESDGRFVNVSGDTITGDLTVEGLADFTSVNTSQIEMEVSRTTSGSKLLNGTTNTQEVDTIDTTEFESAEYTIQANHPNNGRQISKVNIIYEGDDVYSLEYGVVSTQDKLTEFSASKSGSIVTLTAEPLVSNLTIKFIKQVIV